MLEVYGVIFLPRSGEEQLAAPVPGCRRAWRQTWSSSLRILPPMPGARPYPVAPADGVVIAVELRRPLRRMRWGVEGLKTPVFPRSKAVLCPRVAAYARRRSCRREKYTKWAAQWRTVTGKSALCAADLPRAGNSGTVVGAG